MDRHETRAPQPLAPDFGRNNAVFKCVSRWLAVLGCGTRIALGSDH